MTHVNESDKRTGLPATAEPGDDRLTSRQDERSSLTGSAPEEAAVRAEHRVGRSGHFTIELATPEEASHAAG